MSRLLNRSFRGENTIQNESCNATLEEQGFALFLVILLSSLISGLACYYYYPYKEILSEYSRYNAFDKNIETVFGLEETVSVLLPRVNIPLYQRIQGVAASAPLKWTFPYKDGIADITIQSFNDCINISKSSVDENSDNKGLALYLNRLSYQVIRRKVPAEPVLSFLQSDKISGEQKNLTSADYRKLRILSPYLCRRALLGQHININAITLATLPVLETILAPVISSQRLQAYWKNHPSHYWRTPDSFYQELELNRDVRNMLTNIIITEDQEVIMTARYKSSANGDFYTRSHFVLKDGKAILISRRTYDDDSIR